MNGAKEFFTIPAGLREKRDVNEADQNILAEVDGHIVAEILADQVFEQQPHHEHVKTGAPLRRMVMATQQPATPNTANSMGASRR